MITDQHPSRPTAITTVARLLLPAFLVALAACREPAATSLADTGALVVARFGEIEITADDVDARVLTLPPKERPVPGEDLDAWYRKQIREMVVETRLRDQARESGLARTEAFDASRREAEARIAVALCLDELAPGLEEITEDELREVYEARRDELSAPEQRATYHLFVRRGPGARRGIEALRDRVLAGESFRQVAQESSESESRHLEGFLGWIVSGALPAGFEGVVFDLEEGVPSDPVATRDGWHLFYVSQILPTRRLSFEQAASRLRQIEVAERKDAALAELERDLRPPSDALIVDRATFAALVRAGDGAAVLWRLGEEELTLDDLRRRMRQGWERGRAEASAPIETGWLLLEQIRRRALIHHHCRENGLILLGTLRSRLEAWQRRALLQAQRERRMIEVAERDESRLRLFYDGNIGAFSQRPKWHVRVLRIPIDARAWTVMARLERAAASGAPGLETLEAELGGQIEDLGPQSLAELSWRRPKLPRLLTPLAAGQLTPPYRTADALEIVEVVDRREASPLPFEAVREGVVLAYVGQYPRDLYTKVRDEILGSDDLRVAPEGLAAVRRTAAFETQVTVEQLETLLDEL